MEGNFYVSETSIDRELKSKLGHAYMKCPQEAKEYGKCVEGFQINKDLRKDVCAQQRNELRRCVDAAVHASRGPSSLGSNR
jgi:hypothetical protein